MHWRRLVQLGYIFDCSNSSAEDAPSSINRFGAPTVEIFMVSHRWLCASTDASLSHPDDEDSRKAKALVEFSKWRRDWVRRRHGFLPEVCYWIDYCCFDRSNLSVNMAMLPLWIACYVSKRTTIMNEPGAGSSCYSHAYSILLIVKQ